MFDLKNKDYLLQNGGGTLFSQSKSISIGYAGHWFQFCILHIENSESKHTSAKKSCTFQHNLLNHYHSIEILGANCISRFNFMHETSRHMIQRRRMSLEVTGQSLKLLPSNVLLYMYIYRESSCLQGHANDCERKPVGQQQR